MPFPYLSASLTLLNLANSQARNYSQRQQTTQALKEAPQVARKQRQTAKTELSSSVEAESAS